MAKKKTLCRTSTGAFVRNLGWKTTPTGYSQHKFHLGRDEARAALANLRLEQLWREVSARWERENEYQVYQTDRPVWDEVALTAAEAVRNGEPVAKIKLPSPFSSMIPESPFIAEWLDNLQRDITVVKIELLDAEAGGKADRSIRKEGQRLVDLGRRMLHQQTGGETLHAALTVFGKWVESKYLDSEKRVSQWGRTQGRQIVFLRHHLPDGPLENLDARQCDDLLDILRLRPVGENGRPVSVAWSRNVIKQFRSFLRWLNKSPEFAWKRPADLEFGPVRIPLNPGEKGRAARAARVETYTSEELRTLWQYASPFQRLLMLLALNCGFGKAEVASLETAEVHLRKRHPREREVGHSGPESESWILRVRHKSDVYGEWKLWPETASAIEWWLGQRAAISVPAGTDTLLVTGKGLRFDAPTTGNHPNFQLPNKWFQLTKRIRKDLPAFRFLSFNKLRKTAGNLIRETADGEVAGVFLCHGTPVRSDVQLDLYTNRPFARVFEAIDRVGDTLRPVWATVETPFPDAPPKKGGPNITLGQIKRIQTMKRQGYKVNAIAEKVGVSAETVRRWARANAKKPE